jgi:hypothetical protein
VQRLLSADAVQRAEAVERIRSEFALGSEATKSRIEVDLILVIATLSNQMRNEEAVRSAMELAGDLRLTRTIRYLVAFIAFPQQLPRFTSPDDFELYNPFENPGSALGRCGPLETERTRTSILRLCPAVGALIQIGEPVIDPVARELATTRDCHRERCCLKVLKALEKEHPAASAATARAIDKAWTASDANRIARYERLLGENLDMALFADEWDR